MDGTEPETGENAMIHEKKTASICWFVGAAYGRVRDQTPRFLAEGI